MEFLLHCRLRFSLLLLLPVCAPRVPAQLHESYRLGDGDAVQIRFFYNAELNEDVTIRPDGTISMPLIGEVKLSGKTPAEAATELDSRYTAILKQPSITVQVRQFSSQRVYVGGEVNRPGMLPIVTAQSVMDAFVEAGGTKHTGSNTALLIRRGANGSAAVQYIALKAPHGQVPQASLTMLQPFDVLLLPESKVARVDRWVDQYIRQALPLSLNGGFSYLINGIPY